MELAITDCKPDPVTGSRGSTSNGTERFTRVLVSKLILCLATGLIFVLDGCESENIQDSPGKIANLNRGQSAQTIEMRVAGGGRLKNRNPFTIFSLDQNDLLVISYPISRQNQMLHTETGLHQVYVWLVHSQPTNWQATLDLQNQLQSAESVENLSISNLEQLHGEVEIEQADWQQHKNLFHVRVDLAGKDGVTVEGEFNSYDQTIFAPKQLWLDPYLVFFGPFVKW